MNQIVSDKLDNNGQNFEIDGKPFGDWAKAQGLIDCVEYKHGHGTMPRRWVFNDGSVIIEEDGGWDFKHPKCTCGYCWEGAGPHCHESADAR